MSVLIISEKPDNTVETVIEWIITLNKKVFWCNYEEFIELFKVEYVFRNKDIIVNITNLKSGVKINSIWFGSQTSDAFLSKIIKNNFSDNQYETLNAFLKREIAVSKELFFNSSNIRCLSGYRLTNKVKILEEAKRSHLNIPLTIVTNSRTNLTEFMRKNNLDEIIIKSIAENLRMIDNQESLFQPVKTVSFNDIASLPNCFMPTLFQEYIKNKVDMRIFYLNKQCYAISNITDNIDCREDIGNLKFNSIELPVKISKSIENLMNSIGMNMGSIDLLYCQDTLEYYFLEVNSHGQFSFVSANCNYNLEKKVAKYLCYET